MSAERSASTVIVVDDDPSITADFGRIIRHDGRLDLLGTARDGAQAIELAQRLRPSIAIMDVRMPRTNGIEATRIITETTSTAVLIVTTFDLDRDVLAAIRAGAAGFLLKNEAPARMVDAALAILTGEQVFDAFATATLVNAVTDGLPDDEDINTTFTERELEILRLVATGQSNAEIAIACFLSVATVKTHVRSILGKIGAANRTQAVVFAYENGIVTPGQT